jgi:hypothetical protein
VAYVVDEPDQAHDEQTEAVEAQDETVGCLGVLHRVLLELLGLLDEETEDQQDGWEDGADGEACAPDGAQMVVLAGRCHDVWHEGTKNKTLLFR